MPEETAQEELATTSRAGGKKAGSLIVIGGVVLVVIVAIVLVVVLGPGRKTKYISQEKRPVHDSAWLDIPTLYVKNIPLSVPLVASGAQRKELMVGVVIRFAPPEGEKVDAKALEKQFVPRVTSLSAEFRHIVIEQLNSKDYSKLSNQEVKNQLLKNFRQSFQEKLKDYGLDKWARVHDVMWADFFWN
jgi:flagellar basal body-associated protein FliL